MVYTDAVGQWETVGRLGVTTEWQQFPNLIHGDPQTIREVFKLTYECDWPKRLRRYASYGLIRFEFPNGAVAGAFRIYPFPEPKMVSFPIPEEVSNIAGMEYYASVRKVNKTRYEFPEFDPLWTLTLDYF